MNAKRDFLDKVFVVFLWLIALSLVVIVFIKFKIVFHR